MSKKTTLLQKPPIETTIKLAKKIVEECMQNDNHRRVDNFQIMIKPQVNHKQHNRKYHIQLLACDRKNNVISKYMVATLSQPLDLEAKQQEKVELNLWDYAGEIGKAIYSTPT